MHQIVNRIILKPCYKDLITAFNSDDVVGHATKTYLKYAKGNTKTICINHTSTKRETTAALAATSIAVAVVVAY